MELERLHSLNEWPNCKHGAERTGTVAIDRHEVLDLRPQVFQESGLNRPHKDGEEKIFRDRCTSIDRNISSIMAGHLAYVSSLRALRLRGMKEIIAHCGDQPAWKDTWARASGFRPFSSSPGPAKDPASATTSSSAPVSAGEEEWTEVVHSTGSVYYWNQKTG